MSDQEKLGNVIKALELCTSKIETRTRVPCEICPYHNEKYHGVLGDGDCNMRSLQRDMLALLKAQEPKKAKQVILQMLGSDALIGYECGNCGKHINPNDKYCHECGQAVKWE